MGGFQAFNFYEVLLLHDLLPWHCSLIWGFYTIILSPVVTPFYQVDGLFFVTCNFLLSSDRLIVSVAWVAHIIIYLLIRPPLSAFLNEVFIKLDDVWGTFLDFYIFLYIAI